VDIRSAIRPRSSLEFPIAPGCRVPEMEPSELTRRSQLGMRQLVLKPWIAPPLLTGAGIPQATPTRQVAVAGT
jgi:hypothetical protein